MQNEETIDNLKYELKTHLQSKGWETHHAEVVIDGIVESFSSDLFPDGFATYDEMARNQGIGTLPPFDEKAVALLDDIKQLKLS